MIGPYVSRNRERSVVGLALDLSHLKDTSGQGHDLTLGSTEVPALALNPWGGEAPALIFDGKTRLVSTDPGAGSLPHGDWTLQFRIQRQDLEGPQFLAGRWASGQGCQWLTQLDPQGRLTLALSVDGTDINTLTFGGRPLQDLEPHHVAFVRDEGQVCLYLDGLLAAGPTPWPEVSPVRSGAPFLIGLCELPNFQNRGLRAVLGQFEIAQTARFHGVSFVPPSAPLIEDQYSLALYPMDQLDGTRVCPLTVLHTIVPSTKGSWSRPDGPWPLLPSDGVGQFLTVADQVGDRWAMIGPDLDQLVAGAGTFKSKPLQVENVVGQVFPWKDQYHHFYIDEDQHLVHTVSSSLDSAFVPQQGVPGGIFQSVWASPSTDGTVLTLWLQSGDGTEVYSSPNGQVWAKIRHVPSLPTDVAITRFSGLDQLAFKSQGLDSKVLATRDGGQTWVGLTTCPVTDPCPFVLPLTQQLALLATVGGQVVVVASPPVQFVSVPTANPLDQIQSPVQSAYSLRPLRAGWTGPLVQVQRDSDWRLLDVGSDGADLDQTLLALFCPPGVSGRVVMWYDQTGNNRHLSFGFRDGLSLVENGQIHQVASGPLLNRAGSEIPSCVPSIQSPGSDLVHACLQTAHLKSARTFAVASGSTSVNEIITFGAEPRLEDQRTLVQNQRTYWGLS